MNTKLDKYLIITQNSTFTQTNTALINAIMALAKTYAKAKRLPERYAGFDYDFPKMIENKITKLIQINPNDSLLLTLSNSLLKSVYSPDELIDICEKFINRKEYANVLE